MDERSFVLEYVTFLLLVCASASVAVYGCLCSPSMRTKADYVYAANSSISMLFIMLSNSRGALGVRIFLGSPSELFYCGIGMWETLYGMSIAIPIICLVFIPVYFNLEITSVYQYLDLRFKSRLIRCLASGTYVIQTLLNLGVTVFTPCVALDAVIGLPYLVSIIGIVAIAVFFNIMGGLRIAILADIAQLCIMLVCCAVIIVQGLVTNEGVENVVRTNYERGRLEFFNWNDDPTLRVTTYSAIVGQLFKSLSVFGCHQTFVQKYCSMKSRKNVYIVLMGTIPLMILFFSLPWIIGMIIFSSYADCDPKKYGYISDVDGILPFYVKDKLHFLPGFLGFLLGSLFTGALNSCVSHINSVSTVLWEDFVLQIASMKYFSEQKQVVFIKFVGTIFGLTVLGFAYLISCLRGVLQSTLLITSATNGPLLGVFLLASLFPVANWKGAAIGMIVSHIAVFWLAFNGLTIHKTNTPLLSTSIDGCNNNTFSHHIRPLKYHNANDQSLHSGDYAQQQLPKNFLTILYSITQMYYSVIGTIITLVLGVVISYWTRLENDIYEERLIHPGARIISGLFPVKKRT